MVDVDRTTVKCSVKVRYGKKWKQRYCLLKKLSPVADCIHVSLSKNNGTLSRRSSLIDVFSRHGSQFESKAARNSEATVSFEDFCGIECNFELDHEKHVMSLVCRKQVLTFAFYNQQTLEAWKRFVRQHLGEEYRYDAELVKVPSSFEVPQGSKSVSLFIRGSSLCVATRGGLSGVPPVYIASWNVSDLRRFGVQNGLFCFDADNCETSGVFAMSSRDSCEIDCRLKSAGEINRLSRRGLSTSERSLPDSVFRDSLNRSFLSSSGRRNVSSMTGPVSSLAGASSMPLAEINSFPFSSPVQAVPYYNVTTGCPPPAAVGTRAMTNSVRESSLLNQRIIDETVYYNLVQVGQTNGMASHPASRLPGGMLQSVPESPTVCFAADVALPSQQRQAGEKWPIPPNSIYSNRRHSVPVATSLGMTLCHNKRRAYSCSCIDDSSAIKSDNDQSKCTVAEYINMNDVSSTSRVKISESLRQLPPVRLLSSNNSASSCGATQLASASTREYKTNNGAAPVVTTANSTRPHLMQATAKRRVVGVSNDALQPLPYVDLGRFDGDICDDGYLYFSSEDYVMPRSVNRTTVKCGPERQYSSGQISRQENEQVHCRPLLVPRKPPVLGGNNLLNCVPPVPASVATLSQHSMGAIRLFPGAERSPTLSSLDSVPAIQRWQQQTAGYRRTSDSSAPRPRNFVGHRLAVEEPDYLDMSRDRMIEMQRQATLASEMGSSGYLPMDNISRTLDTAKSKRNGADHKDFASQKPIRLIKSQSADGLIDQIDIESNLDSNKAPDLITRFFRRTKNRSPASTRTDIVDDNVCRSLLDSSTSSLMTTGTNDVSRANQPRRVMPDEHYIETNQPFVSNVGVVVETTKNSVESAASSSAESSNGEPPPLPEKQRSITSCSALALSAIPPVPPRAGVDAGRVASQPRPSRKPDLTVDIPKSGSDGVMSTMMRDVTLSNYRPDMFSTKLDSPALSLSNASFRSRRSVQSECINSTPPLHRTTSHATTTLRPRYGKEYQRIDRNRLASSDDGSPLLTCTPPSRSPMSAVSRNASSVFNFDTTPRSLAMMMCSSADNSPKMLAGVVHQYTNVDLTPPIVLDAILGPSSTATIDRSNADSTRVNYTDLDLVTPSSHFEAIPVVKSARNMRVHDPPTEYAQIDLVATVAASQASRMHMRERQDALDRCSERQVGGELKPLSRKGSAIAGSLSQFSERRLATLEPKRTTSLMSHGTYGRRHSPHRHPPPVPSHQQTS